MIRQLTKCIREYKAPTIWTLVLILAEVAIDVIIPFETANLINEVKAGAEGRAEPEGDAGHEDGPGDVLHKLQSVG